jgi:hypothetical protein
MRRVAAKMSTRLWEMKMTPTSCSAHRYPNRAYAEGATHHENAAKSCRYAAEYHAKDNALSVKHVEESFNHSARAHEASKNAHGKSVKK